MTDSTLPSFSDYFWEVHGHAPFPWQVRLAATVLRDGWPDLLDLPTGSGKTSAIDVAIYTLAVAPERLPRRVVLVVDRRIVVDQGATHAEKIRDKLESAAPHSSAWEVAQRLRALWNGKESDAPFRTATLRGGMPRDNDWATQPDQPVVGVSTVDQLGSRLLFRGYGVGQNSLSIHAGLLGNDTLILLDEVHLAVPFAQTLHAIETRYRSTSELLPSRFKVVQMSATAGKQLSDAVPFTLGEEDVDNERLARRINAEKLARLVEVPVAGTEHKRLQTVAKAAIEAALELQSEGARVVGVVLNRVDGARAALAFASSLKAAPYTILVTGRMRAIERDEVVERKLIPLAGVRTRSAEDKPLLVIATQCIEAGADLDFDGLVTECASLDALRQRFGRLDRRGDLGRSNAVILARKDWLTDEKEPVYGAALGRTWDWLKSHAKDDVVAMGIRGLPELGQDDAAALLAPVLDAPVLLPGHLDAWSQTNPLPHYAPDISLWLHGHRAHQVADVQVIWRADISLPDPKALPAEFTRRLELSTDALTARVPSALESVSLPIGAAKRWLSGEVEAPAIADVMAGDVEEGPPPPRKDDAPQPVVALRWRGDESEWVRPSEIRPGDVLIVPTSRGGIAANNFDPSSTIPVLDLADIASVRGRARLSLRLEEAVLGAFHLPASYLDERPVYLDDTSVGAWRKDTNAWLKRWPQTLAESCLLRPDEWKEVHRVLLLSERAKRWNTLDSLHPAENERKFVLHFTAKLDRRQRTAAQTSEDDSSAFTAKPVTLAAHQNDVVAHVRRYAHGLGLSPSLSTDLQLAAAYHDIGKADARFQRWLVGGDEVSAALEPELLAKSRHGATSRKARELARKRAGYPKGYRHELLSVRLLQLAPDAINTAHDPELVLHLIASHHGHCRPFAPICTDETAESNATVRVGTDQVTASTDHGQAALDSGIGDRYWALVTRYGWWGLAWLESILRLADHRASASPGGTEEEA